jgi:hypothetical protein
MEVGEKMARKVADNTTRKLDTVMRAVAERFGLDVEEVLGPPPPPPARKSARKSLSWPRTRTRFGDAEREGGEPDLSAQASRSGGAWRHPSIMEGGSPSAAPPRLRSSRVSFAADNVGRDAAASEAATSEAAAEGGPRVSWGPNKPPRPRTVDARLKAANAAAASSASATAASPAAAAAAGPAASSSRAPQGSGWATPALAQDETCTRTRGGGACRGAVASTPLSPIAATPRLASPDPPRCRGACAASAPAPASEAAGGAEEALLPDGWRSAVNGKGRRYYYSADTQETTWTHPCKGTAQPAPQEEERPADLPPGWRRVQDPRGRCYYYHKESRATQWQMPAR